MNIFWNIPNIVVYHGSFESFISQVPAKTEVRVELHKVGDSLLNYDKNFYLNLQLRKSLNILKNKLHP